MANVAVKENHLRYGGVDYFRGKAEDIAIGSIGEKRTPVFAQNYLEAMDNIPVPKIAVAKATVTEIDFESTSSSALNVAATVIIGGVPVPLAAGATSNQLRNGELKLVKLIVTNETMRKAVNNSPRKRDKLKEWGKDARVAHQLFIAMEASFANKIGNNLSIDLSMGDEGLLGTFPFGHSFGNRATRSETTVTIGRATTFAYLLLKLEWDAKLKKNQTTVVKMTDDTWGPT